MADRPRRSRRRRAGAGTLVGLLLATLGVAIAAGASLPGTRSTLVESGDAPARSILSAANMRPGDVTTGEVTLVGVPAAGALTLTAGRVDQTPGVSGGLLGDRLDLVLEEIPGMGARRAVWSGRLTEMPALSLPPLAEGAARTYRFAATFPDDGRPPAQDNPLQGSSVDVRYDWTGARPADAGAAPPASPTPDPAPAPRPARTPAPAAAAPASALPRSQAPAAAAPRVPRFAIRLAARPSQRAGRWIVLRASCNRACTLLVRGSRQLSGRPVRRASRRPGRPVTLRVAVSPAVREAARAGRRPRVRVSVYAISSDKAATRAARTVRLEPR